MITDHELKVLRNIVLFISLTLFALTIPILFEESKTEVKADETSDDRFQILDYQQVGFLQVRLVCDKETKIMYTWAYAVDNGGNVGGVSIDPIVYTSHKYEEYWDCGK